MRGAEEAGDALAVLETEVFVAWEAGAGEVWPGRAEVFSRRVGHLVSG